MNVPDLKPVILVFVRHYLPGFRSGGPVRSVSNLVKALEGEYEFRIVCLNRDHGESESYADIAQGQWTKLDEAHVYYAKDQKMGFALCRRLIAELKPDMIYLNSLLDRKFSMLPFLTVGRGNDTPVLIAPRGELSPGALGLKAWRKKFFLWVVKFCNYFTHVHWHASSAAEEAQIRQVFAPNKSHVFLASNLPEIKQNSLTRTRLKKPGVIKIVLAARISPMKNTLAAIRMAGQLQGEVVLDLWGPLENRDYWAACEKQVRLCQHNVKVNHRGEVAHEKMHAMLKEYDLMLMPTLGENFGHSIIEALSAGLPVIISDRTPWRNLMATGVGADLPLENESEFVRQLERYQSMGEQELAEVRISCQRFVAAWQADHADLGVSRKMFDAVIASRATPCK
jgi:glycosyltransferase involved in cell wall biosynthesis